MMPAVTIYPIGGQRGPVDLDNLPCMGCVHEHSSGACRRFPPVFRAATPADDGKGGHVLIAGGWAHPPAVARCGEFQRRPAGELSSN